MLTEPRDLDRSRLEGVLEDRWALRKPQLEYIPLGFAGHHWLAKDATGERWFVTVDELDATFRDAPDADAAFDDLDRAFRTAVALRDEARLAFVVAPLVGADGSIVQRLTARYAVTLYPFVEGESRSWGPYEDPDERRAMGTVLGRLHAATSHVPRDLHRRDEFGIPSRAALLAALSDLDREWEYGAFAEPTRELLRATAATLASRLRAYDDHAARVRDHADDWVITHGEPHRANVIRDGGGGIHLVDWDTTLLAPRERDLLMVLDNELTGWDEYCEQAGGVSLDDGALALYAEWWELADIASFVADFRRPHERTEDAAAKWRALESYFAR